MAPGGGRAYGGYDSYRRRTDRVIPLVILEPG